LLCSVGPMTAGSGIWGPAAGFTGRRSERGVLDRFVAGVRAGAGRALVVRGEPGVGKTVLLDYLTGRASGCRVARAAGVQSEMELAFAGLHQLCAPMLEHASTSTLPLHLGRAERELGPAPNGIGRQVVTYGQRMPTSGNLDIFHRNYKFHSKCTRTRCTPGRTCAQPGRVSLQRVTPPSPQRVTRPQPPAGTLNARASRPAPASRLSTWRSSPTTCPASGARAWETATGPRS
jgi:hypothetical protein